MKKNICLLMIIILTLVLCSCMKGDTTVFFGDKDNELADARMEALFGAIKQQDRAAIKDTFSEKAANEAAEIDIEIENFISFIQGDIVSWSREESSRVSDVVHYGYKTKRLLTWYTLSTNKQDYFVLLVDYPIDTIDPKNAGLYTIRILRVEDDDKLEGTIEEWIIPGIYIMDFEP